MIPGLAGTTDAVTGRFTVVPLPQLFDGATAMDPFPEPTVTLILFVVDEPVQPEGNVHT